MTNYTFTFCLIFILIFFILIFKNILIFTFLHHKLFTYTPVSNTPVQVQLINLFYSVLWNEKMT